MWEIEHRLQDSPLYSRTRDHGSRSFFLSNLGLVKWRQIQMRKEGPQQSLHAITQFPLLMRGKRKAKSCRSFFLLFLSSFLGGKAWCVKDGEKKRSFVNLANASPKKKKRRVFSPSPEKRKKCRIVPNDHIRKRGKWGTGVSDRRRCMRKGDSLLSE